MAHIVVMYASIGAGHQRPAWEFVNRAEAVGHYAQPADLIAFAPAGRLIRGFFRLLISRTPRLWAMAAMALDHPHAPSRLLTAMINRTARRTERFITWESVDLVISTYPLGGRVAASALARAGIKAPIVTYLTDPAVHAMWIDDVTNRYLTTWHFTTDALQLQTAVPVRTVAPALAPCFSVPHPPSVPEARETGMPRALVASGSWAVGDVVGAVRDLVADGHYQPVVVCGRNTELLAAMDGIEGVEAHGWVDDMAGLMRTCAVAVINSGGSTLAEAAAAGLPVIHHRPLPGQGRLNAAACHAATGMPVSTSRPELAAALERVRPIGDQLGSEDPLSAALDMLLDRDEAPWTATIPALEVAA